MIELTCDEISPPWTTGHRDQAGVWLSALFRNVDMSLVVQIPRV